MKQDIDWSVTKDLPAEPKHTGVSSKHRGNWALMGCMKALVKVLEDGRQVTCGNKGETCHECLRQGDYVEKEVG